MFEFDDLRERATAEYEVEEIESTNALQELLGGFTAQQRFILSVFLFFYVLIFGCMCLIVTGRI